MAQPHFDNENLEEGTDKRRRELEKLFKYLGVKENFGLWDIVESRVLSEPFVLAGGCRLSHPPTATPRAMLDLKGEHARIDVAYTSDSQTGRSPRRKASCGLSRNALLGAPI